MVILQPKNFGICMICSWERTRHKCMAFMISECDVYITLQALMKNEQWYLSSSTIKRIAYDIRALRTSIEHLTQKHKHNNNMEYEKEWKCIEIASIKIRLSHVLLTSRRTSRRRIAFSLDSNISSKHKHWASIITKGVFPHTRSWNHAVILFG